MNDRFDRELLRWAREPGRLSPPQARAAVLARLIPPSRRRFAPSLWRAAAATAAFMLGLAAGMREPMMTAEHVAQAQTARAPGGYVVLRLSSGTLVFVTLPAPRARGAS